MHRVANQTQIDLDYGYALFYASFLSCTIDHFVSWDFVIPALAGTVIILCADIAEQFVQWRPVLLQIDGLIYFLLGGWGCTLLARGSTPASIFCGISVVTLCSLAVFMKARAD